MWYRDSFIALLITLAVVCYQRMTGPTYPRKFSVQTSQQEVSIKLPRSHEATEDCTLMLPPQIPAAVLHFKRLGTADEWTKNFFARGANGLSAVLPRQPPAGKLAYYVEILAPDQSVQNLGRETAPIVIRFKGAVPAFILIPHILFMMISFLLASLTAIRAWRKKEDFYLLMLITAGFLLAGGMVLGPVVQKFAFGEYWTGIPFGMDLTDNKTLIGVIVWLSAIALNLRPKARKPMAAIVAAALLLLVYSIPHSIFGSQLDYNTMKINTGKSEK